MDKKSYENIFIYDISCKTLIAAKPLCIRFDKIDGFIRVYNGSRYLVLFSPEKYDAIYDRIRFLIVLKSSIAHVFSSNYVKIKIDSDDDFALEETFTLHNVIILLKSVFNKDRSHYKFNILLEKCSSELSKD